ncbi:SKP1-like protein 4 [Platanthera guangdongensis]|uniref:SKP1-like protein n=1 Tax=Platanthera guangdongensis TaxID=2320717 RepID=A0ABR2LMB7_9ASPA
MPPKIDVIRMRCSDGKMVSVEAEVASQSLTLRPLIEEGCDQNIIPIPNVTSDVLSNIFVFCKKHSGAGSSNQKRLKEFDKKFLNVDTNTLYFLLMGAHYLEVKELLNLIYQKVADLVRGKSPEVIRAMFGIENDFTPEEEAAIRNEHPWAFQ